MASFRWDGATGDDTPDEKKQNWKEAIELSAPPKLVFELLNRATACGYWVKWARCQRVLSIWGSRYKITRAGSVAVVFASDNLSDIEEFVREVEGDS